MNREELAWAAGFFDGEGHIRASKVDARHYLRLTIGQVGTESLIRFWRAIGVGRVVGPYYKDPKWKPIWYYEASRFETAQAVVAKLWKWLGTAKREQAKTAIASVASNPIDGRTTFAKMRKGK